MTAASSSSFGTCDIRRRGFQALFASDRDRSRGARSFRASCIVGMIAAVCSAGCMPGDEEINSFIHEWEASVSTAEYRVQPPDSVGVQSVTATEIDGQSLTVQPDGKISLPLVGTVKVAGMTSVEIARKLESLLGEFYVEPQVSVQVTGEQRYFYVFGQVGRPGAYKFTGRDTLLEVLAEAQPTIAAWRSRIRVIHPSRDEDLRRSIMIDADRMIKRGIMDQNVLLQEGDILWVPPTPLAWLALRLREILYPFDPVGSATTGAGQGLVPTVSLQN